MEEPPQSGRLGRPSIEAYSGVIVGSALAVLPMTWWLKVVAFAVIAGLVADISVRSPWTANLKLWLKWPLCLVLIAVVVWVAWNPVRSQYIEDHKIKESESHAPYSPLPAKQAEPAAANGAVLPGVEPLSAPLTKRDLAEALKKARNIDPSAGERSGMRDLLIPASDPIPPNACDDRNPPIPNEMKMAFMGPFTTAYGARQKPFALVQVAGEDLLGIENAPGGVVLDAVLRDDHGELLATIVKNVWHNYAPNDYEVKSDEHSVRVLDSHDRIVLYVRYLNARALKVLGIFNSPKRGTVQVTESEITINQTGHLPLAVCGVSDAPEGAWYALKAALVIP